MSHYDQAKAELERLINELQNTTANLKETIITFEEKKKDLKKARESVDQLARERQTGFPWLAKAYAEFFELQDKQLVNFLKYKRQPAISSSQIVKETLRLRREAETGRRIAEHLVAYYENIAPFLVDLKEEVEEEKNTGSDALKSWNKDESEDSVTNYLTIEEYRKLSSAERNQLALERFWKRPKSKQLIGRLYERYVGYTYEIQGYDVEYVGIIKGFEDLGRDLICKKGNRHVVIQCKNWSRFKTIHENHIFQFFGTVFQYRDKNPGKNVDAIFYSTTVLSGLAQRFAKELKIELISNHKFDTSYPSIKCNVGYKTKEKIYHLPFDQQYDNTKIDPKQGEFYCTTVREAEEAGFRRAFRHSKR